MNLKGLLLISCLGFSPILWADQLSDLKQRAEQGDPDEPWPRGNPECSLCQPADLAA